MNTRVQKPFHQSSLARGLAVGVGLALFLGGFTLLIHAALGDTRLGADFYTFWLAGKAMLLEHTNPYSPEVTLQSQLGIYGRPAAAGEDQVAFAYPPFSLLILIPVLWMSFDWAYAAWLALNIVGFLSLLFFVFRPASRPLSLAAILFYPVFICLVTGNFSVLMAGIVLLFFGLVQRESVPPLAQAGAALLLAWAAAKPQFIWLFTLFILLVALKRRMFWFLGAYFAGLLALLLISFAYVPGWITQWAARVQQYAGYVGSRPVLSELLAPVLPEPAALLLSGAAFLAGLALTGRLVYRWWKGETGWLAVLAWVGLFTYTVHLHGIAYEQMVFLTPLALWAGTQERRTAWPILVFWFGSLAVSWLAFAGGLALPPGPLSVAADRSAALFNAAWVGWLLLSKPGPPGETTPRETATRMVTGRDFQV